MRPVNSGSITRQKTNIFHFSACVRERRNCPPHLNLIWTSKSCPHQPIHHHSSCSSMADRKHHTPRATRKSSAMGHHRQTVAAAAPASAAAAGARNNKIRITDAFNLSLPQQLVILDEATELPPFGFNIAGLEQRLKRRLGLEIGQVLVCYLGSYSCSVLCGAPAVSNLSNHKKRESQCCSFFQLLSIQKSHDISVGGACVQKSTTQNTEAARTRTCFVFFLCLDE